MFSTLKQHIKQQFARIVHEYTPISHGTQQWLQTITCLSCSQLNYADTRFCTHCGRPIATRSARARVTPSMLHTSPQTIFQLQDTDPLQIKPVTISMPRSSARRRFLNYVRTRKEQVGPATQAHRLRQDLQYPAIEIHKNDY